MDYIKHYNECNEFLRGIEESLKKLQEEKHQVLGRMQLLKELMDEQAQQKSTVDS